MKKIILLLICSVGAFVATQAQMTVAKSYNQYLGVLDTLTNTDTTTYTVDIKGPKKVVTWVWDQKKISGTVTQSFKIYGSNDGGTTYTTYAVDSIAGSNNASNVYSLRWTSNHFQKYKVIILSSGTQQTSQRTRLTWYD